MTKANGSVTKRPRTAGSRTRRPKTEQSVLTRVSPEAIERFADAITHLFCAVGRPDDGKPRTGDETPTRDEKGAAYIAAISEQRPGVEGHGYPGGDPDWDDPNRLFLNRLDPFSERSLILPDWMALPLVRRIMLAKDRAQQDEPDETDSGKIGDA